MQVVLILISLINSERICLDDKRSRNSLIRELFVLSFALIASSILQRMLIYLINYLRNPENVETNNFRLARSTIKYKFYINGNGLINPPLLARFFKRNIITTLHLYFHYSL